MTAPSVLLAICCCSSVGSKQDTIRCACDGTPAMSSEEEQLVNDINAYRAANGLEAVKPSAALFAAEHRQALDLCNHGASLSHTGTDGSSMFSRAAQAGYSCGTCFDGTCAFEVAHGATSPCATASDALGGWQGSHCHNGVLLNQDMSAFAECYNANWTGYRWKVIGVGIVGGFAFASFGECDDAAPHHE